MNFKRLLLICGFALLVIFSFNEMANANAKVIPMRIQRSRPSYSRYNVFHDTPLKNFRVVNDSVRVNRRLPRMKRIVSFPDSFKGGRFPQSLNVDPNGRNAYLGFDSYRNDGSKIIRYNFRTRRFSAGRTFSGGHAQAVSLAPGDHDLWMINRRSNDFADDHAGPINKGAWVEVSTKSLRPDYRHDFRFGREYLGDNLAFAGRYGVFNASRIWGVNRTNHDYQRHMLVFYYSKHLDQQGSNWQRLQALRKTPGDYVIQGMAYNPRNRRLYIASSYPGAILSVPVVKVLAKKLTPHDVQIYRAASREIEGLAFDKSGYLYMTLGWPGELLKSCRPFTK